MALSGLQTRVLYRGEKKRNKIKEFTLITTRIREFLCLLFLQREKKKRNEVWYKSNGYARAIYSGVVVCIYEFWVKEAFAFN